MGIFSDVKNAQEMMTAAYGRGNCYHEAGEGREATGLSLDRPGFFNALIQVAIMKFADDGTADDGGGRGKKKGKKNRSTRAGLDSDVPVSDCVRRALAEYVMPLVSKRLVGAMVKHALNSDEVPALPLFLCHSCSKLSARRCSPCSTTTTSCCTRSSTRSRT